MCAGLVVGDSGRVRAAAPILGGRKLEGCLGWWVIRRLEHKGYRCELVEPKAKGE